MADCARNGTAYLQSSSSLGIQYLLQKQIEVFPSKRMILYDFIPTFQAQNVPNRLSTFPKVVTLVSRAWRNHRIPWYRTKIPRKGGLVVRCSWRLAISQICGKHTWWGEPECAKLVLFSQMVLGIKHFERLYIYMYERKDLASQGQLSHTLSEDSSGKYPKDWHKVNQGS